MLSVAAVARARYYVPMTAQRLQEILDPVVTSNGDRLRFESFSGCCGVYARLDVLGDGLDGDLMDRGTTNVDVNLPLRDALARVGGGEPLHLSVGPDDVTVTTLDDSVVERKVPLPDALAARLRRGAGDRRRPWTCAPRSAVEAGRFLRALPGGSNRAVLWAVPAGRTLRLTTGPAPGRGLPRRARSGWRPCAAAAVRQGAAGVRAGRRAGLAAGAERLGARTPGRCGSR